MINREIIDRHSAKIERCDLYLVKVTLYNGTVYDRLEPRRLFPFSNPDKFITLLNENEVEVGIINSMDELDDDSRKAVEDCFAEYYMIPKIKKILWVVDKFGTLKFGVDSDRGAVEFTIRNRHSDIKKLRGTDRVIIRDSNDNRYEIPQFSLLDKHSKNLLFSYV